MQYGLPAPISFLKNFLLAEMSLGRESAEIRGFPSAISKILSFLCNFHDFVVFPRIF